jgi:hypothetical protein
MWRRVDLALTDVSEERRLTQDLHNATTQKTIFFIDTAVKVSNLTKGLLLTDPITVKFRLACNQRMRIYDISWHHYDIVQAAPGWHF